MQYEGDDDYIPERAPRELEVAGGYNAIPIGPSAMKALHACLSTRDSIAICYQIIQGLLLLLMRWMNIKFPKVVAGSYYCHRFSAFRPRREQVLWS
jgi:hypothetical protein